MRHRRSHDHETRAGLVRGCCLTPKAEKLRRSAVLQALAA
jgi:hypothetical protein